METNNGKTFTVDVFGDGTLYELRTVDSLEADLFTLINGPTGQGGYDANSRVGTIIITGNVSWAGSYILGDNAITGIYDSLDNIIKVDSVDGLNTSNFTTFDQ